MNSSWVINFSVQISARAKVKVFHHKGIKEVSLLFLGNKLKVLGFCTAGAQTISLFYQLPIPSNPQEHCLSAFKSLLN